MSQILKILILYFLTFNFLYAENITPKIVYINMEKLFNNSLAGNSLNNQIKELESSNSKKMKKLENEIKKDDENINSKKNILSENELKINIQDLNEKIKKYKKQVKENNEIINNKKITGSNTILNQLKPILSEYSDKNSISMVLQKQNVIIGKKELDITDDIIDILNNKLKKVNIE